MARKLEKRRDDAPPAVLRQSKQFEALIKRHPDKLQEAAPLYRAMVDAGILSPPDQVTIRRILKADQKKPSARSTIEPVVEFLGENYDEAFPSEGQYVTLIDGVIVTLKHEGGSPMTNAEIERTLEKLIASRHAAPRKPPSRQVAGKK